MNSITGYLHDRYGPWGWIGQRAHDAAGINRILPLDFIISCDYGLDIPLYFREKDVFSVEAWQGIRKDWSNEDLNASLKGALGRSISERLDGYDRKANLLCYRSIRRLETGGGISKNLRIFAASENLKKRFDNKVRLYNNLADLSMPRIPGRVDKPGNITFNDLCKELSLPFVVQFPYGSSGHFTFIIKEEKEFNRLRRDHPDATVVMRKYIDGFSLNVNAVIISDGNDIRTVCSYPSIQVTGCPECSNFPTAFCGNDYTAAQSLDKTIIQQVEDLVRKTGTWMAGSGYRGIFGMDFVVKDGEVCPVEINPRFQNSTSLLASFNAIQPSCEEETFFLLHIAEFLQDKDRTIKRYLRRALGRSYMYPVNASQIILHNRTERCIVTGDVTPGVYRLENGSLKRIIEGATLDLCNNNDEVLITCGIPGPYTLVEPNAPVGKIQTPGNVINPSDKITLSDNVRDTIRLFYDMIGLKKTDKIEMVNVK